MTWAAGLADCEVSWAAGCRPYRHIQWHHVLKETSRIEQLVGDATCVPAKVISALAGIHCSCVSPSVIPAKAGIQQEHRVFA
jgi:hypothetical protein